MGARAEAAQFLQKYILGCELEDPSLIHDRLFYTTLADSLTDRCMPIPNSKLYIALLHVRCARGDSTDTHEATIQKFFKPSIRVCKLSRDLMKRALRAVHAEVDLLAEALESVKMLDPGLQLDNIPSTRMSQDCVVRMNIRQTFKITDKRSMYARLNLTDLLEYGYLRVIREA